MPRSEFSTVSQVIAQTLADQIDHCFGVMGNGNAYLLDALAATTISYVAVRHEGGAVAAADAYFRTSGRLAAATTTYGPGFTNGLTALAEAAQARTPLVLITGDAPSVGARPWDVDQPGIARGLGIETFTAGSRDPASVTLQAMRHARDHRTAVVLAIPYDLATAPAEGDAKTPELITRTSQAADADLVHQASGQLSAADRPLLLGGHGAWLSGAGPALTAVASRLGAATTTSALGRGLFDGDTVVDLGICGGFADDHDAKLIASADVILAVGASLNQFTMRHQTAFAADAQVIQVDIAEHPTHAAVTSYLRGDAQLTVQALLTDLERPQPEHGDSRQHWPELTGYQRPQPDPGTGIAADGRLDPRSIATRLNEILPADRTIVSDGGHFLGWAPTYFDIPAPNRLIMVGTAFQTIGLGFPSAVGAAVADSEPLTVVMTGDGGGLMALADFETMIRTVRRGVVVVWNDGYYGAELHQYGSKGLNTAPMEIPTTDFAAMGDALGAESDVITDPDDLAHLERWLTSGHEGTFVADCRISPHVRAPYMSTQLDLTS